MNQEGHWGHCRWCRRVERKWVWRQQQIIRYIIPGTPYIRHKGYVRIYTFIRILPVNLWYLYVPYIFVHIYCALVCSACYQVVTAWYMLVIPVTPVIIRAHMHDVIHLYHGQSPRTQNCFGRGQKWMEVQIRGLHRRRRSRNRWCFGGVRGTNLNAHIGRMNNFVK